MNVKKYQKFFTSNNSSGITLDNSNICSHRNKIKQINKSTSKYLNSSIFESRTIDTNPTLRSDIYITEVNTTSNQNSIDQNKNPHIMDEVFDFKPTKTGTILPSIKKKPPTMIYCCNQKYEANHLSNLYMTYWVNPPKKKKNIVNHKIERSRVRDSSSDFIDKTNSIILARYNLQIKKEAVERIENNVKNEIKSLEHTMTQMKKCKEDLETNFINQYNYALKKLYSQIIEERIKNDEYSIEIGKLNKDLSKLNYKIIKIEAVKKYIEKWIIFQIQMDKKKRPINLKETLKNEYNNSLIFSSVEQFNDWFESKKLTNIYLINQYNDKCRELDEIKKQYLEAKKIEDEDTFLEDELKEKTKIFELLKFKNQKLEKEKKEIIRFKISTFESKPSKSMYSTKFKPKVLKDILFFKTKSIYTQIKELLGNELDYINIDLELERTNRKEEKILKMIRSVELVLNFLLYKFDEYKVNSKTFNLLKEIRIKIDLEHKANNASQVKIEEEKRIRELQQRLERRNKRFIYIPTRKVENYPFGALFKEKKSVTRENFRKKELNISDFLYDVK
jgi:hypothetical protein